MDVRELLRHLQSSSNIAAIGRATGLNRRTVMRYQNWAREQGLLDKPLPPLDQLHHLVATSFHPSPPPQTVSSVAPYADLILALHAQRVDGTAIFQRLQAQGYTGTISSLYRFLHHHNPPSAQPTVRIERDPGTEAQVDFGYAGHLLDPATGQPRKAWAFVMLLAFSRHQYVEFVFDQRLPTWIGLHARAFVFFGGVPHRVVLDNLKAGVTQASFDDPLIQATYRECAEHYGFLLAPCAPRTPQHKGKVEQGGVHYVKRNFLGGREPTTLTQANAEVRRWCLSTAGLRTHGTTKAQPLERFEQIEQACLKPLPPNPYDLATWKKVKLHRDGYVVFEQSYYSAPFRLIGQHLWVRGGSDTVQVYTSDYALVATHTRARAAGERQTHPDHLPAHTLPHATWNRATCRAMAEEIGPATSQLVERLFEDTVVDRLSRVVRILKLGEQVGQDRLEAACRRMVLYDELSYAALKRILEQGLEQHEEPRLGEAAPAQTFIRTASELLGHLFGGRTWS